MVLAIPYTDPLKSTEFNIENLQNKAWIAREDGSGTREYLDLSLQKIK